MTRCTLKHTSKTHQLRRPEIQQFCVTRTLPTKLPFIWAYLSFLKPSSSVVMLSQPFFDPDLSKGICISSFYYFVIFFFAASPESTSLPRPAVLPAHWPGQVQHPQSRNGAELGLSIAANVLERNAQVFLFLQIYVLKKESVFILVNPTEVNTVQNNKNINSPRSLTQSSASIWAYLCLLKPFNSGDTSSPSWVIFDQIIIRIRQYNPRLRRFFYNKDRRDILGINLYYYNSRLGRCPSQPWQRCPNSPKELPTLLT